MKRIVSVILLLCFVFLCSCGPSLKFQWLEKRGFYPTAKDFPNTKWVCREMDMSIYMFDYDESYMIGTCKIEDVSYRVVAWFFYGSWTFELFSSTEILVSEHSTSMVNCNRLSFGHIYTDYRFDKGTNTIVCSNVNYDIINIKEETIPQSLTFDKIGLIAQETNMRWYANEIDMYLDSFNDIDCFFRGEIVIDGKKCYIHALEVGNGAYFMLSIENGKVNNLLSGTTSELIYMSFEIKEDQIIAKVSDEYLTEPYRFGDWPYGDVIITFTPSSP